MGSTYGRDSEIVGTGEAFPAEFPEAVSDNDASSEETNQLGRLYPVCRACRARWDWCTSGLHICQTNCRQAKPVCLGDPIFLEKFNFVRCHAHVVNLTVKIFLSRWLKENRQWAAILEKFHGLVKYVHSSPQRRDAYVKSLHIS